MKWAPTAWSTALLVFYKYGGPCVIVDLGTTINFDVISKDAEYLGGAIAHRQSAFQSTRCSAKPRACPWSNFPPPKSVVGTNTKASMRSGLYYGAIGMIDGILERILEKEWGRKPKPWPPEPGAPDCRRARATSKRSTSTFTLEGPANDLGTEPPVSGRRLGLQLLQLLHRDRGTLPNRARHRPVFCFHPSTGRFNRNVEKRRSAGGSRDARHRCGFRKNGGARKVKTPNG